MKPPPKNQLNSALKKKQKHFELLQVQHQLALIPSQLSSAEYSPQDKEPLEGARLKKINILNYALAGDSNSNSPPNETVWW